MNGAQDRWGYSSSYRPRAPDTGKGKDTEGLPEPFLGKSVPIPLITVQKKKREACESVLETIWDHRFAGHNT